MRARHTFSIALAMLLLWMGAVVATAEWNEIQAVYGITTHPSTGAPILTFSVGLSYDPVPESIRVEVQWTVVEVRDGTEHVIDTLERTVSPPRGPRTLFSASPSVPIAPGGRYRAYVELADTVNDLDYARTIEYLAPISLPTGISLRDLEDTEEFDMTGVPDEELAQLAAYYEALTSEFTVEEEAIELNAFLAALRSDPDRFPALVLLVPTFDPDAPPPSTEGSFEIRIGHSLHVYSLPDSAAIAGLTDQLAPYETTFAGRSFTGEGSEMLSMARSVYVGDYTWRVLAAAASERNRREAED